MSELAGGHPPVPLSDKGRLGKGSPHESPIPAVSRSNTENSQSELDLQARKLVRLFSFCQATACTIATLAYRVAR